MYDFQYHRPDTVEEAAKLFADADDPQFLAGGQTILPVMKQRLAMPSDLIDLDRIEALKQVEAGSKLVTIGAMATHAAVAASKDVRNVMPGLADLARGIGDISVRNRGTIGGSIANNDPAADYPAAIVGLDATVHTDRRAIPADDFFTGMFETALEEGELIIRVEFPVAEAMGYEKFHHPASRYAMVGVLVARTGGGVRVAVTGAGPCVFRAEAMEQALAKEFSAGALEGVDMPADGLNSDLHASTEYRAHLIGVLARRAVEKAS